MGKYDDYKNDWGDNLHMRFLIWILYKFRATETVYDNVLDKADRLYWTISKLLAILCGVGAILLVYPHLSIIKLIIVVVLGFVSIVNIYRLGYDDGIEYSILDLKRDYTNMRKSKQNQIIRDIQNED